MPEKDENDKEEMVKANWDHDLPQILKSKRVVKMTFHVPQIDKDKEFITADAMAGAIEHYRHFPIISEFHKERPIGVAEKIWQTGNDEFNALARIREDPSVDDVWEKIERGQYNQVSIAGRRTEFSQECNLHQALRSADQPCRTTGLRLDSISVCDEAARNDGTNLAVVKAVSDDPMAFTYTTKLVLTQVEDTLIKAETTNSPLIHPVTDGTKRKAGDKGEKMKKCNEPPVKKGDEKEEMKEKEEETKKGEAGEPEKQEMEKAPVMPSALPAEPGGTDTTLVRQAGEGGDQLLDMMKQVLAKLGELVESDKKVHTAMKAETPVPDEAGKEDTPDPAPVQKATMEQDFQKALDAAISPLKGEIETLKKALADTNAKLEAYGEEPMQKAGIRIFPLNVDHEGKPIMGNAGAIAEASKQAVKQ